MIRRNREIKSILQRIRAYKIHGSKSIKKTTGVVDLKLRANTHYHCVRVSLLLTHKNRMHAMLNRYKRRREQIKEIKYKKYTLKLIMGT